MVQIITGTDITRPTTTPLTSSVLDHATVVENGKFGLRNNEGLWPSYNCMDVLNPVEVCSDVPYTKKFGFAEWTPAFEFAVQGGVQCQAVGLDRNDMKSELSRVFALNEGKGVERGLAAVRFVASDSDSPGQWDAPVDTTPGGPVSLLEALARLEGYAAAVYSGQPTIHMPRAAATLLGDKIQWIAGKAYTRGGAKVAIGGGYDDPDTFGGPYTLYATGEVYVERSSTVVQDDILVIPGDGSGLGSDQTGIAENSVIGLVERMYRVAVDCFVAKAEGAVVTAGAGGGSGLIDNGDGTWSTP